MKRADLGLWLIVAAFLVWEIVCYSTHNAVTHTLSWNLWHWATEHPWLRVVYAVAIVVLFLHIVFRWPHRRKKGAA